MTERRSPRHARSSSTCREARAWIRARDQYHPASRPVLAVMPWELYESLVETLEILGDPDMSRHSATASKI